MRRFSSFMLISILLVTLTSCSSKTMDIYTVPNKIGSKTVVCYGTVECEETTSAYLPSNTTDIVMKVSEGEYVQEGQIIVEYSFNGVKKSIVAEHDGIICNKDSYSSKEKASDCIKYFNLDNLIINAQIAEAQANYYENGLEVNISGSGFKKSMYSGVIYNINSLAQSTQNGSYLTCQIKIDDPDTSILPGFTARVEFKTKLDDSVVIPISAIGYGEKGYYVLKLNGQDVSKIAIEGITLSSESFCSCKGIRAGDRIIRDISKVDI